MVDVVIVTGFLGAGKTTFLMSMRESGAWAGEKWAVVVNEFGKVGIDGSILQSGSSMPVVEIADGCLCCTLKGDFQEAVVNLVTTHQPDRILIEPSGIFALSEMADLFAAPPLSEMCRVQAVVAVVDPTQFTSARLKNNYFVENQIRHANLLVLSKSGIHAPETEMLALQGLRAINEEAAILTGAWDGFDFGWFRSLLDEGAGKRRPAGTQPAAPPHGDEIGIQSFGLRALRDLTEAEYRSLLDDLIQGAYGEVLRMKGYLRIDGRVCEVNHVFGEGICPPNPDCRTVDEQQTKISLIGKRLQAGRLNRFFWAFPSTGSGELERVGMGVRNGG